MLRGRVGMGNISVRAAL